MKYKVILFDLDFTLYNECKFLKEIIISSKIFYDLGDTINKITYRFRVNSQNIIDDLLSLDDKLTKENRDLLFHKMKEINLDLSCYDGIIKMLEELKNNSSIKTGLITNGVPEIQRNKMQCLGIKEYFNHTICAKELGSEKPSLLPFEKALCRFNVDPKSTLYVGDHPLNDIKPANDLGMDTLWIDHLNKNNMFATYKINDPNKLAVRIGKL